MESYLRHSDISLRRESWHKEILQSSGEEAKRYAAAVDIGSLGVVLCQLLGELPPY